MAKGRYDNKRIAFFGGSFNPAHFGHIKICESILQRNIIDSVHIIPVYRSPQNKHEEIASYEHRLRILQFYVTGRNDIQINEIEKKIGGVSYTIRTFFALKKMYGSYIRYMIIGSDSAMNIMTWKRWKCILKNIRVLVYPRAGYKEWRQALKKSNEWNDIFEGRMIAMNMPCLDVSSTLIRKMIRTGDCRVSEYVHKEALAYIRENRIYETL